MPLLTGTAKRSSFLKAMRLLEYLRILEVRRAHSPWLADLAGCECVFVCVCVCARARTLWCDVCVCISNSLPFLFFC